MASRSQAAALLREYAARSGLSHNDLAEAFGVTPSALSYYKRNGPPENSSVYAAITSIEPDLEGGLDLITEHKRFLALKSVRAEMPHVLFVKLYMFLRTEGFLSELTHSCEGADSLTVFLYGEKVAMLRPTFLPGKKAMWLEGYDLTTGDNSMPGFSAALTQANLDKLIRFLSFIVDKKHPRSMVGAA